MYLLSFCLSSLLISVYCQKYGKASNGKSYTFGLYAGLDCSTGIAKSLIEIVHNIDSPSHVGMSVAVIVDHIRPSVIGCHC